MNQHESSTNFEIISTFPKIIVVEKNIFDNKIFFSRPLAIQSMRNKGKAEGCFIEINTNLIISFHNVFFLFLFIAKGRAGFILLSAVYQCGIDG